MRIYSHRALSRKTLGLPSRQSPQEFLMTPILSSYESGAALLLWLGTILIANQLFLISYLISPFAFTLFLIRMTNDFCFSFTGNL